jgi:F0F1-type ATP synthase membrane subunit b/b'
MDIKKDTIREEIRAEMRSEIHSLIKSQQANMYTERAEMQAKIDELTSRMNGGTTERQVNPTQLS